MAKPANSGADADADDMAVDDQDVAWGEIDGMWKDVWDSIKFLRKHAIDHESGRRLSELRKLDLRSQNNVIVTLYNYGWFEDRPSDIALEMLAIYLRHRSASATITTGELRECRKLYEEWNKLVSAS